MVSLKLDNNLAPIGEILKGILKRNSLDIFGNSENDLLISLLMLRQSKCLYQYDYRMHSTII
jgi:hypothetical protein